MISQTQTVLKGVDNVIYELFFFNERKRLLFYYDIQAEKIYSKEEIGNKQKDHRIMNI
jgi:hypothetical protein